VLVTVIAETGEKAQARQSPDTDLSFANLENSLPQVANRNHSIFVVHRPAQSPGLNLRMKMERKWTELSDITFFFIFLRKRKLIDKSWK
jgi:hypothetical protein